MFTKSKRSIAEREQRQLRRNLRWRQRKSQEVKDIVSMCQMAEDSQGDKTQDRLALNLMLLGRWTGVMHLEDLRQEQFNDTYSAISQVYKFESKALLMFKLSDS